MNGKRGETGNLLLSVVLGNLVYHSSCNGISLGTQINRKIFKAIFLDVGFLLGACGLTMKDIIKIADIMLINMGLKTCLIF